LAALLDRSLKQGSEQQYRRKFEQWGLSKNIPSKHWRALSQELKRQGLKTDDVLIYYDDRPIDATAVRKEVSRNDPPSLLRKCDSDDLNEDILKRIVLQVLLTGSRWSVKHAETLTCDEREAAHCRPFIKLSWMAFARLVDPECFQVKDQLDLAESMHVEPKKTSVWSIQRKETDDPWFSFGADDSDVYIAKLLRFFQSNHDYGSDKLQDSTYEFKAASIERALDTTRNHSWSSCWLGRSKYLFVEKFQATARALKQDTLLLPLLALLAMFHCLASDYRHACFAVIKTYNISEHIRHGGDASKVVGQTLLEVLFLCALEAEDLDMCSLLLAASPFKEKVHSSPDCFEALSWDVLRLADQCCDTITKGREVHKEIQLLAIFLEPGLDRSHRSVEELERNLKHYQKVPNMVAWKLNASSSVVKSVLEDRLSHPTTHDLSDAMRRDVDPEVDSRIRQAGNSTDGDTNTRSAWAPIVVAATTGVFATVKLLINHESDINVQGPRTELRVYDISTPSLIPPYDRFSLSPLAIAAARGDDKLLKLLIQHGGDVNFCAREFGLTPLQAAIIFRQESTIEILCKEPRTGFSKRLAFLTRGFHCFLRPFYLAIVVLDMTRSNTSRKTRWLKLSSTQWQSSPKSCYMGKIVCIPNPMGSSLRARRGGRCRC